MTTATAKVKQHNGTHSETRKEQHLRLLSQLNTLPLSDSCCEICHCDCYSSHRSSELNWECELEPHKRTISKCINKHDGDDDLSVPNAKDVNSTTSKDAKETSNKRKSLKSQVTVSTKTPKPKKKSKTITKRPKSAKTSPEHISTNDSDSKVRVSTTSKHTGAKIKRSKSTSSLHSQAGGTYYTRDCKILQELLSALSDTPKLQVISDKIQPKSRENIEDVHSSNDMLLASNKMLQPWPSLQQQQQHKHQQQQQHSSMTSLANIKLCSSMATLCLAPTVREAFSQVPTHDQKILNRMATKRSEHVAAKENAWLARKYWENERYERELLKCEQMEEYKRAIRDKQFQDYLLTKARLNEIAQRDLTELHRLRQTLHEKDERARRRLDALRVERDLAACQRRCEELRKNEAVNVQQEEQHHEELQRKREICHRITDRLQRAEQIRTQMLESYLKRVRYDNYIEQLTHDEHWRATQQHEWLKREQLMDHISRKRTKSQNFAEQRQRRNQTLSKNAKISASLRELVRSSVTPDAALLAGNTIAPSGGGVTVHNIPSLELSRWLLDRPVSKLSNCQ